MKSNWMVLLLLSGVVMFCVVGLLQMQKVTAPPKSIPAAAASASAE